jgi:RNA polymerase sigma-70 factor, ECF subfamily
MTAPEMETEPSFADAVAALFDARFRTLFRYLNRLTGDPDLAADLAQEAFVRLYQRGAIPDDPNAWLATVATNLFRDVRRRTRRRAELAAAHARSDGAIASDAVPRPDAIAATRETRSRVRGALTALPRRDRELLLLRHEGYSYRDLARIVGVAEGSVGTLLIRATRAFRAAVERATPRLDAIYDPSA